MGEVGTTKVYENEKIIVWEFTLEPGEETPLHEHKHDYIFYIQNGSKLLDFQILDIGEGKILNIAKYNNKKDFEDTNKWLQPLFTKMMKELDGILENIPGETIIEYKRDNAKN